MDSELDSVVVDSDIEESFDDLHPEEEDKEQVDDELLGPLYDGSKVTVLGAYNGIQAWLSMAIHSNCNVVATAPAVMPKCQQLTSFGICIQDVFSEILVSI